MGGDFFGAIAFLEHSEQLGAARSTRSNSDFEGGDFWTIAFLGVLGVARSARGGMADFWGLFLIGSVGFSGLGHLFSDAALL